MTSQDLERNFMSDKRSEIRETGIQSLADSSSEIAEELLVWAMADQSNEVWKRTCEVLLHRQPWLILKPFLPRTVPNDVRDTTWGTAWSKLRAGIRNWLNQNRRELDYEIIARWVQLPGAVPDICEELEAIGRLDLAERLSIDYANYDKACTPNEQIILAPTYRCNFRCDYCYAKGWDAWYGEEMSLEDLGTALCWCTNHGINLLILGGGEPTVYSNFSALLKKARENQLRVWLASNTVYPQRLQEAIRPEFVECLICHYNQSHLTRDPGLIERFTNNLKAAKSCGVEVFLRYTLTQESDSSEWRPIIELAEQYDIGIINYAFAFGNSRRNNRFIEYQLEESNSEPERKFLSFHEDCDSRGIELHQCKPIPLCIFSEFNLRSFLLRGSLRNACTAYLRGFSKNLTINPDLTTLPCNAIGVPGPVITEFESLEAAGRYYEDLLKRLLFQPFQKYCEKCLFHYRGFCHGVCLAEIHSKL